MKESVNWKINGQKLFSIFKRERKALKKELLEPYKIVSKLWHMGNPHPKRRGQKGVEKIFEEMMSENIPSLEKYTHL